MKQRGDQTEIMLLRPCVITPAFNYVDIWPGRASIPRKFKFYRTSAFYTLSLSCTHTHTRIFSQCMCDTYALTRQCQLICTETVESQYAVPIIQPNFLHFYCNYDHFTTKTYKYLESDSNFLRVRVKKPLKEHLDHHKTLKKLSTESVDTVFNPSMVLCTAGGRENLRTDRQLKPSPCEIGKATWLGDNRLEKDTVVFHYYSWVYFKMYSPAEKGRRASKRPLRSFRVSNTSDFRIKWWWK